MPPRNPQASPADAISALVFDQTPDSKPEVRVTHDGPAPEVSTEPDTELDALHKQFPNRKFWRGQGNIIYSESALPPELG